MDFNLKSSVHIEPENSQWLQDWGKKSIFCYYLYKFVACVKLVQTRLSLELVQVLDIILMPRYFHSCLYFINCPNKHEKIITKLWIYIHTSVKSKSYLMYIGVIIATRTHSLNLGNNLHVKILALKTIAVNKVTNRWRNHNNKTTKISELNKIIELYEL